MGGLAASYLDPQGFLWDHGGHVMFSHYQYFDELVEKMLRGDYDQHLREAWVWMCDRFVPYPFQNNIHRLPPTVFLECLMGIIEAQRADRSRDDFDEWISAIFGDGIARHFMAPYNFKVWAHPLSMMSTSWQGDRVPDVDVRRILENLLEDRDDVSWGPNNKFKFPLLGTGMLYERIAESLPKPVHLEKEAVLVDTANKRVTFSDGTTADYDALVSTMPLTELLQLIPERPPELDVAALDLHHTEGLFVGIGVADPCPEHQVLDVLPGARLALLPRHLPVELLAADDAARRSLLAARGGVLVALQGRGGRDGRRPHHRGDGEQQAPHARAGGHQDREPPAPASALLLPRPHRRARWALAAIQPWLMSLGIWSRGRFGAWRYEIGNTDHSVMMGVELADHLLDGKPEVTWSLLPGEEARATIA